MAKVTHSIDNNSGSTIIIETPGLAISKSVDEFTNGIVQIARQTGDGTTCRIVIQTGPQNRIKISIDDDNSNLHFTTFLDDPTSFDMT